jgi:hypothetical protein
MTTSATQSWSPYEGGGAIILTIVLLIVAGALVFFAFRLRHSIAFKRPGQYLIFAIVVGWLIGVVAVLVTSANYIIALYRHEGGHLISPPDYITPVTYTLLVLSFFLITYLARRIGFWGAVGSAIVGTIAAPIIFEIPFDLIILWRVAPPPPPGVQLIVFFFTSFILCQILSLLMLTFTPVVRVSRLTLFLLAGMFIIFAVWAMFGFAYPATPLPIALNMISKILAFATSVSLFLPAERSAWFGRQPVPARKVCGQ